jgi:hypothetical protein
MKSHWDLRISGPMTVEGSRGSPTFMVFVLAMKRRQNSS